MKTFFYGVFEVSEGSSEMIVGRRLFANLSIALALGTGGAVAYAQDASTLRVEKHHGPSDVGLPPASMGVRYRFNPVESDSKARASS